MKRKLLRMMLIVTMAAATVLTGCGTEKEESAKVVAEADEDETEEIEEENGEETGESEETEDQAKTPKKGVDVKISGEDESVAGSEESEESEDEESIQAERGSIEDGMFINETFGIAFPTNEDMYFLSDREIMQVYGAGTDVLEESDDYTAEELETALQGCLNDALIMFSDGRSNLLITYDNMDITANGVHMSEDLYKMVLVAQMENIEAMDYEFVGDSYIEMGGEEYLCIDFEASYGGEQIKQTYYLRRESNYMIGLVFTCYDGDQDFREAFLESMVDIDDL